MTRVSRAKLDELSKEDLILLVERLFDEVECLRVDMDKLKQPPPTSGNSSQPPSRDFKSNRPERRTPKPRGAEEGHAKMERKLVNNPDQVIMGVVERCPCGADLRQVEPSAVVRRQITELPKFKPVVIETRQQEVICPCCKKTVRGKLPEGLEAHRAFGPRLEALAVYLQHQQHLGYERTQMLLKEIFDLELSDGGQACIIERAGNAAQPLAESIRETVRQSRTVGSDETSVRKDGQNWWQWVFRSTQGVYHLIRPSRGVDVIQEMMGEWRVSTWVCDCWAPQLKAPAERFQLCLAHQIRNLQGLRERCPRLRWARELQALFREAIHLVKRQAELTERGYQRRVKEIEGKLTQLIDRPVTTPQAQPLVKRYRKHREHLLVFLHDPSVPHHNNDCERSLRSSVVHRKITGGFRSEWGPHAYAALASVIDTAKLQKQSVFETLVNLMGKPVLPFLTAKNS